VGGACAAGDLFAVSEEVHVVVDGFVGESDEASGAEMVAVEEAGAAAAVEAEGRSTKTEISLVPDVIAVALGDDLAVGAVDVVGDDASGGLCDAVAVGVVDVERRGTGVDVGDVVFGVEGVDVDAVGKEIPTKTAGGRTEVGPLTQARLFFAVEGEAEIAVDPGVFVVDDGVWRQSGRGDGDSWQFFYGGADGHEFDEAAADFGDVGFDADDIFGFQEVGFVFETSDGDFACVVNKSGEFGDFAFAERFECGEKSADQAE